MPHQATRFTIKKKQKWRLGHNNFEANRRFTEPKCPNTKDPIEPSESEIWKTANQTRDRPTKNPRHNTTAALGNRPRNTPAAPKPAQTPRESVAEPGKKHARTPKRRGRRLPAPAPPRNTPFRDEIAEPEHARRTGVAPLLDRPGAWGGGNGGGGAHLAGRRCHWGLGFSPPPTLPPVRARDLVRGGDSPETRGRRSVLLSACAASACAERW